MNDKKLEELRYYFTGYGSKHDESILKLIEQNKSYRETLEFYANRNNYKLEHYDPNLKGYMSIVDYDEGLKARKELERDS